MSRPGVLRLRPGVGCLGVSRPARDLRWPWARHARDQLAVRAAALTTWALRTQCARDPSSGCVHCAPNPVLVTRHCSGHCLNTVHRVFKKKKKEYKIFTNFYVYDLKYKIINYKFLQICV